jgi:nitrogen fixation protein FixH
MKASFNPWPVGIVVFFVLLLCGMATVVAISVTHRETMVNPNYYEQELKFQNQIDSAARAQKAGARVQLNAPAGRFEVMLPAQQLAARLSGTIEFYRPSAAELDREYPLAPGADGTQFVDISKLAAGPWQVRVKWNAGGQDYFLEEKITL